MNVLRNLQRKSKRNPKSLREGSGPTTTNRIYYFGSFCLNQAEQQLLRNGEPVRLAPKGFEVLRVLIENKGCLVTKERLLREVWPNVFVEEANLTVNIAGLRKALGNGNAEQQCIETVPKRGYRFMAQVSELTYLPGRVVQDVPNSLAVLPFANEGCGPAGEYLSTGLMESITNSLSQSPGLRVMAGHTVYSFHRGNIDPRIIGHELGVRSVLVGRILQLDDSLIVRSELIDVMYGWQLWGEQYRTRISDVLLTQQELAAQISAAVLAIS
jgi:DNA-binding winged helix-turn-helix (wHTH) protein